MKLKTNVKAGGINLNHNQSKGLSIKTTSSKRFAMKAAFAALVVAASLATTGHVVAQPIHTVNFVATDYSTPPVPVMTVCDVNGTVYPVDYNNRIWGTNNFGAWVVIGRMYFTPSGPVAESFGYRYAASCN